MSSQQSMASQISSAASRRPSQGEYQQQPQPNGYPPPTANGYYQNQRQGSGLVQPQPQPQYLPQPSHSAQRPYPQPQRIDSRQPVPSPYNRQAPNRGYPPSLVDSYKPVPNRGYPSTPALNSDPYRTQSMASMRTPAPYNPPPSNYNQASATSFRQQPYQSVGSRTTAQGRVVPERHDERAMSMSSFSMDRDHNQTMSGRVIPNRRRESGADTLEDNASMRDSPSRSSTLTSQTVRDRTVSPDNGPSRTMSMASTIVPPSSERSNSLQHRPSMQKGATSTSSALVTAQARAPLVYPALLSRVADVFRERIQAGERTKNELSYKFAFTGAEAVDLISYIIKTTDRNLALLLGRALDAQKFFHDVTYDHRLRDSASEIFQFRESLMEDNYTHVNGVFTLLTECYSPTCTRDKLCYSIACPRRLEQQARLNMKPQPGLRRQQSSASLHADETDEQKLWINTVSQEVADSVNEREKKRQEVISEIMYTERDFVKDLEYLRDFWMKPLRSTSPMNPSPIPERHRERFVRTVFGNFMEVHAVNSKLAEALTRRQQEDPVVRNVGDIFLEWVPRFGPFVKYGANQLWGKHEFEAERTRNPQFSKFVDETERLKESRKLELNGYLTKPTTRLARYPLLLENVLKYTAEDNPDTKDIPQAIAMIKEFLQKVNDESGKAENKFNLRQLQLALKWTGMEKGDHLKLLEEGRQLVYKGPLKKSPTDSSEVHVYLFNHALLFVKQKTSNRQEELRVYKKPIPLELLVITQMDEVIPKLGISKRPSSSLIPGAKAAINGPKAATSGKEGYPITFQHIGKGGYDMTLYAMSTISRRKWMENIEEQQEKLRSRGNFYTKTVLCDNFFTSAHKVNCLVPIDGGRKLVFGTDTGIYVSDRKPKTQAARPKRVLDITNVTQIDVLEEYQLLLVLATKSLMSYPLEVLDPNETQSPMLRRPKKIQNHANFFKAGVCMGRHLVCSAKMSGISTTIKVYEPMDTISKGKKKPAIGRMFQGGQEALKPFKEFYVPAESTSIDFLRSKLCVACSRGFEVVSLETLETQPLLDHADTSLDFVTRKDIIPVSIERLNGEFLLHYTDFSFFVNRNGWRARPDWLINWEGKPSNFALSHPYLLAFEPNFIEIRHLETSQLVHIITAKNIRMLHSSTREILYAYEDDGGEDVVASLDFWSKPPPQ
uniref:Putative rho guanyl nucleotide exchange factor n=1 Tax=Cladonia uncialis subsp. uncialis TaxID=180999 RepID=A0A1Z1C4V6_CLAUC|nr:putative rho guanyl nucleotide exchange factor [Cladonia uncialis subsp. uncialis]AUW30799.1 putative rho guanyl nucleotide exchange factor [Cladonia uncialis subsp. uncialis]